MILALVLWQLSIMRVTRLINFDEIMDWLHIRVAGKWGPGSWQAAFVACPWCISMWPSLFTCWVPVFFHDNLWVLAGLAALAASMVTGLLSPLSAVKVDMEPQPPKH